MAAVRAAALFTGHSPEFRCEPGMAVAEGGLVMVHGRYVGWAAPKPMTAVDIFRIEDGEVAEHWDVIQEEAVQTASGYQMFP